MSVIKRRKPFFLLPNDERMFSDALIAEWPDVRFLDQNQWPPSPDTDAHLSIDACSSKWVYIWQRNIMPKDEVLSDRSIANLAHGFVLPMERSIFIPHQETLWSGVLMVGIDMAFYLDLTPLEFSNSVIRILLKQNSGSLDSVSVIDYRILKSKVKKYVVGTNVFEWCRSHPRGLLRDRSTPNYYRPSSSK